MHGNSPHAGRDVADPSDVTPETRRTLRRDCASVAALARELLPDDFAVGSELVEAGDGIQATVAVQPPTGAVVSAGFSPDEDADFERLATELAAGAALQVKRAPHDVEPAAS